jgi:hypothetical protein
MVIWLNHMYAQTRGLCLPAATATQASTHSRTTTPHWPCYRTAGKCTHLLVDEHHCDTATHITKSKSYNPYQLCDTNRESDTSRVRAYDNPLVASPWLYLDRKTELMIQLCWAG